MVRNIREYVPKTIGEYYIKAIKENLRFYLLTEINKDMQMEDLMTEDPEVAKKRNYYIELLKILKNSEKIMLCDEE
jgi:hypothetical protein